MSHIANLGHYLIVEPDTAKVEGLTEFAESL